MLTGFWSVPLNLGARVWGFGFVGSLRIVRGFDVDDSVYAVHKLVREGYWFQAPGGDADATVVQATGTPNP